MLSEDNEDMSSNLENMVETVEKLIKIIKFLCIFIYLQSLRKAFASINLVINDGRLPVM